MLLAVPSVVAQVDSAITRSGEVGAYDGTRADFLTVAGKLSRYPRLSKAGMPLHYAPIVTTDSVSVATNTATVYGNIVFNGWYDQLTAQGFQLSTSSDFSNATDYPFTPVNTYSECDQPCAANVFSVTISNLTPGATYYVRAYATNAAGTTYSDSLIFLIESTGACPGTPTVTDHQGNVYTTVQIGYQCWTRQNMRCTSLPSNPSVELEITNSSSGDNNIPMAYFGRGNLDLEKLGYRYNWPAAMDTTFTSTTNDRFEKRRGICPEGWHVPSLDEWNILLDYLKAHGDIYGCGGDSTLTAKALASTTGWSEYSSDCAIGNNPESNNASGFTAYPGTNYDEIRVWTSTSYYHNTSTNPSYAFYLDMSNSSSSPRIENCQKSYGNSVRCVRDTTGLRVPSLTATVDNVTQETASVLSAVTADGGAEITERGICWSTDTLPTIDNYRMVDTTGENIGLGDYISQITTLTPSLTYHVRAYAINFEGVGYSEDVTFTTPSPSNLCEGTPTVTDHEGNVYNTVKIGYQCWTRENMRCTTLPDGTPIGLGGNLDGTASGKQAHDTLKLYYNDLQATVPLEQRGYYYNWYAAMDTVSSTGPVIASFEKRRGICPEGWHVPSYTELDTLENYMSRQSEYQCRETSGSSKYIAKALASKYGWKAYSSTDSCYVGVNPENNNASGMSMVPAGYWTWSRPSYIDDKTEIAYFWSSSIYHNSQGVNEGYVSEYELHYDRNSCGMSGYSMMSNRNAGMPVRCLRDTTGLYVPTVNAHVDTVTSSTVTISGAVTAGGGETVTAFGLCYSPDTVPTINDPKVVLGSGLESFTGQIVGLVPNTTYYVRAYATNYEGTGYTDLMVITTPAPEGACPGTPTVTDHEGNVYNTVQIGDQCWMRENMRCVTTPNHPDVNLMTTCSGWSCMSNYEPHVYSAFNFSSCTADPSMLNSYGYFYNWPAAMDTTTSDYIFASFENHRGICPEGWHIPSMTEWKALGAYVSSQEDYRCNNNSNYIARALCDQSSWESYSGSCCPGQDLTQNNATGFTAVATGYVGYSSGPRYYSQGYTAQFWSSSVYVSSPQAYPYYTALGNQNASFLTDDRHTSPETASSVRCIKDEAGAVEKTNPTVITTGVSEIGATSVKFTGEVVSDGNATVTQRGFCWGSNVSNLDTNHTHAAYGTGEGVFEATIADFTPGYTYYMRAYAVNSLGITYGEPDTFTLSNDFHVDVLPYVSDFSDSTSWALNDNGNEYNCYWLVGEQNDYYAGRSLFVTSDGTTASCNNSSYSRYYLSAEKYLKMPACDSVHVEFDVLAGGYYDYHYMKAFLAPVSYTFTSSSNYFGSSYSTNAVDFQKYMLTSSNSYYLSMTNGKMLHVSVNMPNPAPNDTCKLAFLWNKGSYSYITQPGAIVANVLVSTVSAATDSVMGVTSNSANVYGKVAAFGDETVTERGVCWATHARPTASDNHLTSSVDTFSVNITGLVFNTEYYVRAYAKTSDGITVFGDEILFRTKMAAECYSPVPYNTNFTDGNKWVVNNGDAENYWTMGTPTNGDTSMLYITNDEQFAGQAGYKTSTSYTVVTAEKPLVMPTADSVYVTFDTKIGGESYYDYLKVFLAPESFEIPAYYSSSSPSNSISHYDSSRYAMNFSDYKLYSEQLAYPYIFNRTQGNVVHIICRMANPAPGDTAKLVFLWRNDGSGGAQPGAMIANVMVTETQPEQSFRCGTDKMVVPGGHSYETVKYGSQCWTKTNLREPAGTDHTSDKAYSNTLPYYYVRPNVNDSIYGYYYNWEAAKIACPEGWHLPSDAEWNVMESTLTDADVYPLGSRGDHAGKMAIGDEWGTSSANGSPGHKTYEHRNQSGFSARGVDRNYYGNFESGGWDAYFWTSSDRIRDLQYGQIQPLYHELIYAQTEVQRGTSDSKLGYSVRCVQDMEITSETCPSLGTTYKNGDDFRTSVTVPAGVTVVGQYYTVKSAGSNPELAEMGAELVNGNVVATLDLSHFGGSNVYISAHVIAVGCDEQMAVIDGTPISVTVPLPDVCPEFVSGSENATFNGTDIYAEVTVSPSDLSSAYWNSVYTYFNVTYRDGNNNELQTSLQGTSSSYGGTTRYYVSSSYFSGYTILNVEAEISRNNCTGTTINIPVTTCPSFGPQGSHKLTDLGDDGVVVAIPFNNGNEYIQFDCDNMSSSDIPSYYQNDTVFFQIPSSYIDDKMSYSDRLNLLFSYQTSSNPCMGYYILEELNFRFTCGNTFVDRRGEYNEETYATVSIGNQCWMAENLRATLKPDGSDLVDEYYNPLFYYPDNNSDNVLTYGLLYTWNAMMNGEPSSTANPSTVQGICPNGWHVPSRAEWLELIDTATNMATCGNAIVLADNYDGWNSSGYYCSPGYDLSQNNASGFSARAAGYFENGIDGFGVNGNYWTGTEVSDNLNNAYRIRILNSAVNLTTEDTDDGGRSKENGHAVRCVKDVETEAAEAFSCGDNIQDNDGNTYATVAIGNQCWMKENLRTTKYPNGNDLVDGDNNPLYDYPGDNSENVSSYGLLYSWVVMMNGANSSEENPSGVRGICPEGWHVPSDAEWMVLITTADTMDDCGAARALAGNTGWNTSDIMCAPGFNLEQNNATGFSALPAGDYSAYSLGNTSKFWTATEVGGDYISNAYHITIKNDVNQIGIYDNAKHNGFSVRCVKDANESEETALENTCPGTPTVSDNDGHTYNTVQIGNQCWMRENLRTTKKPNDDPINGGFYAPDNDEAKVATCGYLYTWDAMMNDAQSSDYNPSGVQGICPEGWHVPSTVEFDALLAYLSSNDQFRCGSGNDYYPVAKALADTAGWSGSSNTCAIGNDKSTNNASHFSALPSGYYYVNGENAYSSSFGSLTSFWSTTESSQNTTTSFVMNLYKDFPRPYMNPEDKVFGFSVRCVKN